MKGVTGQPVAGQRFRQRVTPACRAAEPDAGAGFEAGLDVGGVERALCVGQAAVQAHAGLLAEAFEVARVGGGVRGAVEEVGFGNR